MNKYFAKPEPESQGYASSPDYRPAYTQEDYFRFAEEVGVDTEYARLAAIPASQVLESTMIRGAVANVRPAVTKFFGSMEGRTVGEMVDAVRIMGETLSGIDKTMPIIPASDEVLAWLGEIPAPKLGTFLRQKKKGFLRPRSFFSLCHDVMDLYLSVKVLAGNKLEWRFDKVEPVVTPYWEGMTDRDLGNLAAAMSNSAGVKYLVCPIYLEKFIQYMVSACNLTLKEDGYHMDPVINPFVWPRTPVLDPRTGRPADAVDTDMCQPFLRIIRDVTLDDMSRKDGRVFEYACRAAAIKLNSDAKAFDHLPIRTFMEDVDSQVANAFDRYIADLRDALAIRVLEYANTESAYSVFDQRHKALTASRGKRRELGLDAHTDYTITNCLLPENRHVNLVKNQVVLEEIEKFCKAPATIAIGVDSTPVAEFLTRQGIKECYDKAPKIGVDAIDALSVHNCGVVRDKIVLSDVWIGQSSNRTEYDFGVQILNNYVTAGVKGGAFKMILPRRIPDPKNPGDCEPLMKFFSEYDFEIRKLHRLHNEEIHILFNRKARPKAPDSNVWYNYVGSLAKWSKVSMCANRIRDFMTVSACRVAPGECKPPKPNKSLGELLPPSRPATLVDYARQNVSRMADASEINSIFSSLYAGTPYEGIEPVEPVGIDPKRGDEEKSIPESGGVGARTGVPAFISAAARRAQSQSPETKGKTPEEQL